jgi:hypothetical protein
MHAKAKKNKNESICRALGFGLGFPTISKKFKILNLNQSLFYIEI